jgi:hypothetical protein
LDHALPSMDAAMHAIQSLSQAELAELRNMKNPSDLVQQARMNAYHFFKYFRQKYFRQKLANL